MGNFITLLLGFILTAFSYLLVPTILCFAGKNLTKSQIKKIVLTNGIIVWLIWRVICFGFGITNISISPLCLWSGVAYFILKKACLFVPQQYVPKYKTEKATVADEKVGVTLAKGNEKTYGNYHVYGKDLELKPETPPTIEGKEKPSDDGKLTENRKQLVNLAMNVPENKVDLALKLLHTLNETN